MTIYVVRHPATPWTGIRYVGRRDLGWSRSGSRRADQLVACLGRRLGPSAIVITSPLQRARSLADRLASAAGSPVEVDDRWLEVDVGWMEGCTFGDIENLAPDLAARLAGGDLDLDWPAGERSSDFEARVLAAFADVRKRVDRPAVIVTHAGPIALLLRSVQPAGAPLRFIGAGDALALEGGDTGLWTVRPVSTGSR